MDIVACVGDASTSKAGCPRCGVTMGRSRLFACTSQLALHLLFQPVAGASRLQGCRHLPRIDIPYMGVGTSGKAQHKNWRIGSHVISRTRTRAFWFCKMFPTAFIDMLRARFKTAWDGHVRVDTVAFLHLARKLHATCWRAGQHAARLGGVSGAVSVAGQRAWPCSGASARGPQHGEPCVAHWL